LRFITCPDIITMLQLLAVVDDIMTVNDWSIVDNVFAHRNEFSYMSTPCDVEQQIPLLVQKTTARSPERMSAHLVKDSLDRLCGSLVLPIALTAVMTSLDSSGILIFCCSSNIIDCSEL